MAALGVAPPGARAPSRAAAFLRGTALRRTAAAAPRATRTATATRALFGLGNKGPKQVDGAPMICIDCGYIYRGDFNALPPSWECPPCGSGKKRFKPQPAAGMAYADLAAQKKANKAALASKSKGGPSKRELLKQKMLDQQAEMDDKKKGGFFGR